MWFLTNSNHDMTRAIVLYCIVSFIDGKEMKLHDSVQGVKITVAQWPGATEFHSGHPAIEMKEPKMRRIGWSDCVSLKKISSNIG